MSNGMLEPNRSTQPSVNSLHQSAIQAEQERLQKALAKKMAESASSSATSRLSGRTLDAIRPDLMFPSSLRSNCAGDYAVLPVHLANKIDLATAPRWRVELHGLNGSAPLGFDLIGDVVIGRGKDGPASPDVDLELFGGQKMGVSRRHVILRPTEKHLYLIDLNSTNGTVHNGLPVGPGVARSVQHNDSIMLGDLTFTLKIIGRPGSAVQPNNPAASYADLLNQERARKAAEGKNDDLITRRMDENEPLPPAPKFSAQPRTASPSDTPPRPLPAMGLVMSRPNPAPEQPEPPQPAKEPEAKPAKIMGLKARLLNIKK